MPYAISPNYDNRVDIGAMIRRVAAGIGAAEVQLFDFWSHWHCLLIDCDESDCLLMQ
jgi:hypothetical protein